MKKDPHLQAYVDEAFERAIACGRLSANPRAENYSGLYMYMGATRDGLGDAFKHVETRQYLPR